MLLISSDLGWFVILFCVICRTQIRRSCPQKRYPLATLSKQKERISWNCIIYKTSIGHAQSIRSYFKFELDKIFRIKSAFVQQNRKQIIKKEPSVFIVAYYSVLHRMVFIGQAHCSQFIECRNLCITKHAIVTPNAFLKIAGKPNNCRFYLPNFFKFCNNISHILLNPSQFLEKCMEIWEWFNLKK